MLSWFKSFCDSRCIFCWWPLKSINIKLFHGRLFLLCLHKTSDVVPSADCHGKPPLILFFKHLNKRASVTNEIKWFFIAKITKIRSDSFRDISVVFYDCDCDLNYYNWIHHLHTRILKYDSKSKPKQILSERLNTHTWHALRKVARQGVLQQCQLLVWCRHQTASSVAVSQNLCKPRQIKHLNWPHSNNRCSLHIHPPAFNYNGYCLNFNLILKLIRTLNIVHSQFKVLDVAISRCDFLQHWTISPKCPSWYYKWLIRVSRETSFYRVVQSIFQYFEPNRCNSWVWRMDRQTDTQTFW